MKLIISSLENQLFSMDLKIKIINKFGDNPTLIIEDAVLDNLAIKFFEFRTMLNNFSMISIHSMSKCLIQILGVGKGSTPISDDFLIGILFTIYLTDPFLVDQYELLAQFPFQKYTTSKSAQLIRKFLRNNFPKEVRTLFNLFKTPLNSASTVLKLENEIKKIKLIGVSSGYYFLLGILWELKFAYFWKNSEMK